MKQKQSLAGYIRERLSAYEERLAVGIRQEVILEELAEAGYETTIYTLRTLLSRARKKREAAQEKSSKAATNGALASPPAVAAVVPKKQENALTKPAGFDAQALKNQQDTDLI